MQLWNATKTVHNHKKIFLKMSFKKVWFLFHNLSDTNFRQQNLFPKFFFLSSLFEASA